MKKTTNLLLLILALFIVFIIYARNQNKGKHLFILSGQSNMHRLDPNETFAPVLKERCGDEIIIVKDAMGGQPIKQWYRKWKNTSENESTSKAVLYDSLIHKVDKAIKDEKIATVTFIWMQGERDARQRYGELYEESLHGLYNQLSQDLQRSDVNFIIGRLSDFDMNNQKYAHWTMIRDVQVKVAESNPRFEWVNTDDLNEGFDPKGEPIQNDLHMSVEGYKTLGKRFAKKAIQLIENDY